MSICQKTGEIQELESKLETARARVAQFDRDDHGGLARVACQLWREADRLRRVRLGIVQRAMRRKA